MFRLDPSDPNELTFAIGKAVKQSGLSLSEICDRLERHYGEKFCPIERIVTDNMSL